MADDKTKYDDTEALHLLADYASRNRTFEEEQTRAGDDLRRALLALDGKAGFRVEPSQQQAARQPTQQRRCLDRPEEGDHAPRPRAAPPHDGCRRAFRLSCIVAAGGREIARDGHLARFSCLTIPAPGPRGTTS